MDLPVLSQPERAVVARTWAYRGQSERRAEKRFARLARELEQTGASPVVIDLTRAAVDDEQRHAGLCDALAEEYGWAVSGSASVADPAPLGPPELGLSDRVLFEMVAFCAFTETLNAAMLTQILKRARVPRIRDAVHAIVKDEVAHSRAGWAHLHDRRAQGHGAFLSALLPQLFEQARVEDIFRADPSREGPRMADYGELDDASRTAIFRAVMRDVFFPGLESLGLDTRAGRDWLSERQIRLDASEPEN